MCFPCFPYFSKQKPVFKKYKQTDPKLFTFFKMIIEEYYRKILSPLKFSTKLVMSLRLGSSDKAEGWGRRMPHSNSYKNIILSYAK